MGLATSDAQAQLDTARRNGWLATMQTAEKAHGLPAGLLAAIASRETGMRDIVGDQGHGRGLMQIDDRSHARFLNLHNVKAGQTPPVDEAVRYAAAMLGENTASAIRSGVPAGQAVKVAVAGYNAGVHAAYLAWKEHGDPDQATTGRDYSRDVLGRREKFAQLLQAEQEEETVGAEPPPLVSRHGWGAQPPTRRYTFVSAPEGVFLHYTSSASDRQDSHALCADRVKRVQAFHMGPSRGWNDIGYSFLYCRHGVVFEGRGWGVQGAHTVGFNATAHAMCFLGGDQVGDDLTDQGRYAVSWLIHEAFRRYPEGRGKVRGHGDVNPTACPGREIAQFIDDKGWLEVTPPEPEPPPLDQWYRAWADWYKRKPRQPEDLKAYEAKRDKWRANRPDAAPRQIPDEAWKRLAEELTR